MNKFMGAFIKIKINALNLISTYANVILLRSTTVKRQFSPIVMQYENQFLFIICVLKETWCSLSKYQSIVKVNHFWFWLFLTFVLSQLAHSNINHEWTSNQGWITNTYEHGDVSSEMEWKMCQTHSMLQLIQAF